MSHTDTIFYFLYVSSAEVYNLIIGMEFMYGFSVAVSVTLVSSLYTDYSMSAIDSVHS
jgi:hypothetical protein